jgi:hypothetical protein
VTGGYNADGHDLKLIGGASYDDAAVDRDGGHVYIDGGEASNSGADGDVHIGADRGRLLVACESQFSAPIGLPTYTVATAPSAALYPRGIIYVSDETGGATPAFSDGTDWRRTTDRQVITDAAAGIIAAGLTNTQVACSDEATAITTGTAKVAFRMVGARTLVGVRASLSTAQTSGSIFTVDINKNGTTVLSTKLTIDNTEKTSTTAAAAAVISVTSFADDDEVTIDVDQVGDGTAKGLKVTLLWG